MTNQVYQMVTDKILDALDKDIVPWQQPWGTMGYPRNTWGKPYRGVNVWLLSYERMLKGYQSNFWLTYKQISERGGQVRKGEKSTSVIFWKVGKPVTVWDEEKQKSITKRPFILRYFSVFNLMQQDGMKLTKAMQAEQDRIVNGGALADDIDFDAEAIIGTYFARDGAPEFIEGQDDGCWYSPSQDKVHMPNRSQFVDMANYYASIFHEMEHSTGHPDRLARKGKGEVNHFGDDKYGFEELVAEFGASMLMAECGIDATLDNNAAYIQNWKNKIKAEPQLVVQAAGKAQKAADYILGVEYKAETED